MNVSHVQYIINTMITIMMARFMFNHVPHAVGLVDSQTQTTRKKTKYRIILEHKDPVIAAAEKRSGTIHERYKYAYSREQVKFLAGKKHSMYNVIEVCEVDSKSQTSQTSQTHSKLQTHDESSIPNELPTPTVSEVQDNITVRIPGIRAAAELSVLEPYFVTTYDLPEGNWFWFNRLINQSGIPHIGTLLLDTVLNYFRENDYSILNSVHAYGRIKQKELENWYLSKGFVPVDRKKYGNALLKWRPDIQ